MGNKTSHGYTKGIQDSQGMTDKLAEILTERHEYVMEEGKGINWNVYRLMAKKGGHLAVVIPQDYPVAISFGISFTNDNRVTTNFEVSPLADGRPLIAGMSKFNHIGTIEGATLTEMVNCYLDQLQLFGGFNYRSNNCVDFTKRFTEALTKERPHLNDSVWQCEAAMARIC